VKAPAPNRQAERYLAIAWALLAIIPSLLLPARKQLLQASRREATLLEELELWKSRVDEALDAANGSTDDPGLASDPAGDSPDPTRADPLIDQG
jgi:hypothetical protein